MQRDTYILVCESAPPKLSRFGGGNISGIGYGKVMKMHMPARIIRCKFSTFSTVAAIMSDRRVDSSVTPLKDVDTGRWVYGYYTRIPTAM